MIGMPVLGPFQPDPNVSVAIFSVDDTLWVVNRRALHDGPGSPGFGLLEFRDVRAHRVRSRGTDLDGPPGSWAMEVLDSEYLRHVIDEDEQRTAEALASHRHYMVNDGNHRCVDVIARELNLAAVEGPILPELRRLMSEFAEEFS